MDLCPSTFLFFRGVLGAVVVPFSRPHKGSATTACFFETSTNPLIRSAQIRGWFERRVNSKGAAGRRGETRIWKRRTDGSLVPGA